MSLRLAMVFLAAMAVTSTPAFACKGSTVIFQDNFQTADPAWHGELAVADGHANVTASPTTFGGAFYGGKIIDSGDACVDMVGPNVADPSTAAAGIMFGFTDVNSYYLFMAREDGQAAVIQFLPAGDHEATLTPVAYQVAPALKPGANVTNTLRVTWSGTRASTYINDQLFFAFDIQALQNTMIGLYVGPDFAPDTSASVTYQFNNLKVTNAP